jgi:nitrous oxidase accessory protein NosD
VANNVSVHSNVVHSNGAAAGIVVNTGFGFNEIIDNSIIGNVGVGVFLDTGSTANVVAGNTLAANTTGALTDGGTGNHVGEFVGGASLLGGNQYSNIVY